MSYALVQKSLDQSIDRKSMEEASVHVPSVARGDCARLHRDLFGIVVTGLSRDDAIAFQVALEHYDFPTGIVRQEEIPRLPEPVVRRGIRFEGGEFVAIDGLGREDRYGWNEVGFATGGFTKTVAVKVERQLDWNRHARRGSRSPQVAPTFVMANKETEIAAKEFRLDLFLSREPYRLQFRANEGSLFRCDGALVRFREEAAFRQILQRVASFLPNDSLGLGLLAAREGRPFLYPSRAAADEEATWHLMRRMRS